MPENLTFSTQPYADYFNEIGNAFSAAGALGQQSLQPQIRSNARFVSSVGYGFTALAAAVDAGDENRISVTAHLITACPQSSTDDVVISHEGTKFYAQLLLSCAAQAKTAFLQAV
jgi:hypothetical protein